MAFVDKRLMLAATLAVLTTAALLLAGNAMNPVWPLMWVAFIPVLLLAAETTSWRVAAGAAVLSVLLGNLTLLYYIHFVLRASVTAWLFRFRSPRCSSPRVSFCSVVSSIVGRPSALWSRCPRAGQCANS